MGMGENVRAREARRAMFAAMMMATAAAAPMVLAGPVWAQDAAGRNFDIPAQPLSQALILFAAQSGYQVATDGAAIQGVGANGVSGALSPLQALSELLAGTGFTFRIAGDVVTLEPAPQVAGATLLGAVRVEETARVVDPWFADETGTAETGYVTTAPTAIGPWEGRSLQDTPFSVSIVPAELIENIQATTVDQIYRMSPTIQLRSPQLQLDGPSAHLRGFLNVPPARNGLPGSEYAHGTTTEDVERIEILTGLSGFMYGPGNVGGVINYVSKRPTRDRLNSVTVGNAGGGNFYAHGDFGGAIDPAGRFGYRINAVAQDGETVVDDFSLTKYFLSGAFDWNVTDRLLVQVDASYRDFEAGRQAYWALAAGATRPSADLLDPNMLWSQEWSFNEVESTRLGANVRWDVSSALTFRAAYLDRDDVRTYGFPINTIQAGGAYNQLSYKTPPQDIRSEAWNAFGDLRFQTGSIEHKLTFGHVGTHATRYNHPDGEVNRLTLTGAPLTAPTHVAEPVWPSHGQLPAWNAYVLEQSAWMIGDDIALSDRWSMLVGLNRSTITSTTRPNPAAAWRTAYDESATTPTASLIFKPNRDLSLYATYAESLEQGGEAAPQFNGFPVTNAGEILSPLMSDQIEAGAKARVGGVQLTAAVFEIQKGLQYYDISTPAQPTFVQDGRQVHRGLELTATGRLTDNLTVVSGFTLLDAEVTEQKQNPALEGKAPNNTSERLVNLYLEYALPNLPGLTLTGGVNYVGPAWGDALNTDRLPDYVLLDLGARYETIVAGRDLVLRLNVTNVTDERYWINSQYLGDARTVLFSMSTKF